VHVLRYLDRNRNHPTVDQIYRSLLESLPGLSRASVYNSLAALGRAGLVRPLAMDGNELRYDSSVGDHGHFRCRGCGVIYDFDLPPAVSASAADGLQGFQVDRHDFLAWGLCPGCAGAGR
jgi:Fur family peroxide stress response transcriptional regulator